MGPEYKKPLLFVEHILWKSFTEEVILEVAHEERVEKC